MNLYKLLSPYGEAIIDLAIGNIADLRFTWQGRDFHPLHRAHWLDDPSIDLTGVSPVNSRLAGDFFCAPFGLSDVEEAPPHGWTANSPWQLVDSEVQNVANHPAHQCPASARFKLQRLVMGASIEKTVAISQDSPLLYQTHHIIGGREGLTVAHHVMTHLEQGGRLFFSPKRCAMTPEHELETGRSWLRYPAESSDLTAFPTQNGKADLSYYPQQTDHEDFITLIEEAPAESSGQLSDLNLNLDLGWTAIIREAEDDIVFTLKDARVLPLTMLWFSNGGRDHSPWLGKHTGVLGIEDGITAGAEGHAAALGDNRIREKGVATCLPLAEGKTHTIKHVTGVIARPTDWHAVTEIKIVGQELLIYNAQGDDGITIPFDSQFFDN